MAKAIVEAFAEYRREFLDVTRRARESFERRDWARLQADSRRRLGMNREAVDRAEVQTRVLLGDRVRDRLVWVSAKAVYSALIAQRQDWDLAETFFNGVTRRIFDTVGVDPLVEFVASDFDAPPSRPEHRIYRRYTAPASVERLVRACLEDHRFAVPWVDLAKDVEGVTERTEAQLASLGRGHPVALEVIESPFFRGKGAYLVGRLVLAAGVVLPHVMALRNGPRGVFVDAVLHDENEVSILFSFTRSYFHVEAERPYDVMRFLRSLIPKKRIAELYIAIGEPKQGKTELYRAMVDHIDETHERFGPAPGVPGLVMVVFTMPGMDVVMKVIRDRFPPEKETTATRVRERYQWVYRHDRAGRLVDAQEFEHLAFPKERFDPELLHELLVDCAETVRVDGDRVIVEFCYVERQLVPLNLFVRQRPVAEAIAAAIEYGHAIKDLAACNIFPGDLLTKNFGVTRHGRVALYDYDELCELTSMTFREIPVPESIEEEMYAEPFFAVGPRDVFPEEFPRYLGMPAAVRSALLREVPEIFTARWWRGVQARVREGRIVEFLPYPPERRIRDEVEDDD